MIWDDIDPPTEDEIERWQREIEEEQANWDPLDLPESQEQLVKDLHAAGAPKEMISKTGAGAYHDYVSPHPMPKHLLEMDAKAHGLDEIVERMKRGDYDP